MKKMSCRVVGKIKKTTWDTEAIRDLISNSKTAGS